MSVHDSNKMSNGTPPFALKVVHFLRHFTIRVPSMCTLNDANPASPPSFPTGSCRMTALNWTTLLKKKNENALRKIVNTELVIKFLTTIGMVFEADNSKKELSHPYGHQMNDTNTQSYKTKRAAFS